MNFESDQEVPFIASESPEDSPGPDSNFPTGNKNDSASSLKALRSLVGDSGATATTAAATSPINGPKSVTFKDQVKETIRYSTLITSMYRTDLVQTRLPAPPKVKEAFIQILKQTFPECVRGTRILYPIDDQILRDLPEIHDIVFHPKPAFDSARIPVEIYPEILEIWSFCSTFRTFLNLEPFNLDELYASLSSDTKDSLHLISDIIHSMINCFMEDLQSFGQTDPNHALALQLSQEFHTFPVEAGVFILGLKRYKKCVGLTFLEALHKILTKYDAPGLQQMNLKERTSLLQALVQGLMVTQGARDHMHTLRKTFKVLMNLFKSKYILEKDVKLFETMKENAKGKDTHFNSEKQQKLDGKKVELEKVEMEILELNPVRTEMIGTDCEGREYWTFMGDFERLHVRVIDGMDEICSEKWGTYSKTEQVQKLLKSLCEQGINEQKLKARITQILPYMSFDHYKTEPNPPYTKRVKSEYPATETVTIQRFVGALLQSEERYTQFFLPRALSWTETFEQRESWKENGIFCKTFTEAKKWALEFITKSMKPIETGDLARLMKTMIKHSVEYDYTAEEYSEDELMENASKKCESATRSTLKGTLWKDLGPKIYQTWHHYIKNVKNVGELHLAFLLYQDRLEAFYKNILRYELPNGKRKPGRPPKKTQLLPEVIEEDPDEPKCYQCGGGGELVFCKKCNVPAHPLCVGRKERKRGPWFCQKCEAPVTTKKVEEKWRRKSDRLRTKHYRIIEESSSESEEEESYDYDDD